MTPNPPKGGSKFSTASTDQTVWTRDLKIVPFCRELENKVLINYKFFCEPHPPKRGSIISAASTDLTVWTTDLKIVSFCRKIKN